MVVLGPVGLSSLIVFQRGSHFVFVYLSLVFLVVVVLFFVVAFVGVVLLFGSMFVLLVDCGFVVCFFLTLSLLVFGLTVGIRKVEFESLSILRVSLCFFGRLETLLPNGNEFIASFVHCGGASLNVLPVF